MVETNLVPGTVVMAFDREETIAEKSHMRYAPVESIPIMGGKSYLYPLEIEDVVSVPEPEPLDEPPTREEWNATIIEAAIRHYRPVVFDYAKENSIVIERRSMTPMSTFASKGGAVIALGEDHARGQLRGYRLDRIQGYVSA